MNAVVAALREAKDLEREARGAEAMAAFAAVIALAEAAGDDATAAEAARRLAVLHQQRGDSAAARRCCTQSYEVARRAGLEVHTAKALNTLGVLQMLGGEPANARESFDRALLGGHRSAEVRARAEQNLGVLANIRGDLPGALAHYGRSLEAYRELHDEHGCAISFHNLGMVSADRGDQQLAEESFRASLEIAQRIDDRSLRALCLVSLAELDIARQRFENARQNAEEALELYGRIGSRRGKADAYRVIGVVYRETGRPALAESRLTAAIQLALVADATLIEAEACRDLALQHRSTGRNQDALVLLNRAHRLFRRLEARTDAVNVGGRIAELQSTYLRVVREWGESIESSDSNTFGHCERVAQNAVAMCRVLGFDETTETTILLGAYLHDVGMVRVPHEILASSTALAPEEAAILEMHPVWGMELLAAIDFPWDLKPIVRWHHERRDGSGYPDGLRGDAIPLGAEIVGILDTYEELLGGRFGRSPLAPADAVARIIGLRAQWSDRVLDAFLTAIARPIASDR